MKLWVQLRDSQGYQPWQGCAFCQSYLLVCTLMTQRSNKSWFKVLVRLD